MFIQRFTSDPGLDVLVQIEAVDILDLEPPESISAIGTGTVCVVGEFEDGPYTQPYELSGASDLGANFGGVGFAYGSVRGNNPCARIRYADGALAGETWNGHAGIQLTGKKFARLQVVRVNTSVGSVTFTPLAYLVGSTAAYAYSLVSGQVLALDIGSGPVSSTFTGTAATIAGASGTYPTTFAGGETLTLSYDNAPTFTVTFKSTDQSNSQVVARINSFAGFTFASVASGQVLLTGRQLGTGGSVTVVGGSSGVLTKLGLTATTSAGGGNVVNINAVLPSEVKTIVEAAVAGTLVEQQLNGYLRISATTAASITVGAGTTASVLGFAAGATDAGGNPVAGTIPAGTVVQPTGSPASTQIFVTAQTVSFGAGGVTIGGVTLAKGAPIVVPIRHATDDGTGVSVGAGAVVKVPVPIASASFSVSNVASTSAALTEAQIDAQYVAAFTSTLDPTAVTRQCNVIFSARQSNVVRRTLRQNAIDASSNGLYGRMAIVRSPLGTTKTTAQSPTAEPGVGAYRDQRTIYVWPGANTYVAVIASVGTAGGTGFTPDGNVDVGLDGFLASVMSQIAPEENPGELTSYLGAINSFDTQAIAQGKISPLLIGDYKLFKAAGIVALVIDDLGPQFQSGVTSVDPTVNAALVRIARRRMADFVQDSIARSVRVFGKKVGTLARRNALVSEVQAFMEILLSKNNSTNQRIAGYTIDQKSGNTPDTVAAGVYVVILNVRTLTTMDNIVIASTIGDTVTVTETLPQAA